MEVNGLRGGLRAQALQEVKASLVLDKVAEEEKIEVSDEEINREIDALATQSKQTPEAIRARLTRDGALDRIRNRIRSEKTSIFYIASPPDADLSILPEELVVRNRSVDGECERSQNDAGPHGHRADWPG